MKKKLEAELISIAHRILQMKNKSDLEQLLAETQKLQEKLAVLRFVEEHFAGIQPTIGRAEVEQEVEKAFGEKQTVAEPMAEEAKSQETTVDTPESDENETPPQTDEHAVAEEAQTEVSADEEEPEEAKSGPEQPEAEATSVEEAIHPQEEAIDTASADSSEDVTEEKQQEAEEPVARPSFELSFERADSKPTQITFDDLMQHHYDEPVFVKAGDSQKEEPVEVPETPLQPEALAEVAIALEGTPELEKEIEEVRQSDVHHFEAPKASPIENSKSIVIGLNDRIGFEKNLFGGSSEDLNRVLSQLNTLGSFAEAKEFIHDMVKPDYNNWVGKEDYEQRFLDIVEQKFN